MTSNRPWEVLLGFGNGAPDIIPPGASLPLSSSGSWRKFVGSPRYRLVCHPLRRSGLHTSLSSQGCYRKPSQSEQLAETPSSRWSWDALSADFRLRTILLLADSVILFLPADSIVIALWLSLATFVVLLFLILLYMSWSGSPQMR